MSPIISAAAVEAVRPGLRTALAPASSPATPPARRAGQPTTRASGFTRLRGEQRDADEQPEHADAEQQADRRRRLTPPAKMPVAIAASEASEHAEPALGRVRRRSRTAAGVAPSRTAAIGGTRVARRAGRMLASSVIAGADSSETMTVRVAITVWPSGRSTPSALEQGDQALGDPDARDEPDHRRDEADDEALEHDRAHDLLARGAERPQRGELARALGDRDRQRVEDHERADEQRDAAEAEQDQPDGRAALVDVVGVVLGLRPWCP